MTHVTTVSHEPHKTHRAVTYIYMSHMAITQYVVPEPHVIASTGNHSMIVTWLSDVNPIVFLSIAAEHVLKYVKEGYSYVNEFEEDCAADDKVCDSHCLTVFDRDSQWVGLIHSRRVQFPTTAHFSLSWLKYDNVNHGIYEYYYWVCCHVTKEGISIIIVMLRIGSFFFICVYACTYVPVILKTASLSQGMSLCHEECQFVTMLCKVAYRAGGGANWSGRKVLYLT